MARAKSTDPEVLRDLQHIRDLALGRLRGGGVISTDRETWYHVEAAASRALKKAGGA
jgi:hypothetical protein